MTLHHSTDPLTCTSACTHAPPAPTPTNAFAYRPSDCLLAACMHHFVFGSAVQMASCVSQW